MASVFLFFELIVPFGLTCNKPQNQKVVKTKRKKAIVLDVALLEEPRPARIYSHAFQIKDVCPRQRTTALGCLLSRVMQEEPTPPRKTNTLPHFCLPRKSGSQHFLLIVVENDNSDFTKWLGRHEAFRRWASRGNACVLPWPQSSRPSDRLTL